MAFLIYLISSILLSVGVGMLTDSMGWAIIMLSACGLILSGIVASSEIEAAKKREGRK